jgi:toxin ParE1/3/4
MTSLVCKFQITNRAKADLKSIATFTQKKWGQAQRRLYLKQFDDAFCLLAESPEIGTDCSYIKSGYRKFPVASHMIFYRSISDELIEIVRILHKRMDVSAHFIQP